MLILDFRVLIENGLVAGQDEQGVRARLAVAIPVIMFVKPGLQSGAGRQFPTHPDESIRRVGHRPS